MKKENLLSKAEMKKVKGGDPPCIDGLHIFCSNDGINFTEFPSVCCSPDDLAYVEGECSIRGFTGIYGCASS